MIVNQKEKRKTDAVYVTSLGALILELCDGALPLYMRTGQAPPRPAPPPRNAVAVMIEEPSPNDLVLGQTPIVAVPTVPPGIEVASLSFYRDDVLLVVQIFG